MELLILNHHCPTNQPLCLNSTDVPVSTFFAVGDFNSHSQSWGYSHKDRRGEAVETWQDNNQLIVITDPIRTPQPSTPDDGTPLQWIDPKDTPAFYSRWWHTTSTPHLALCMGDIYKEVNREVGEQLGGSDHRPMYLTISWHLKTGFSWTQFTFHLTRTAK